MTEGFLIDCRRCPSFAVLPGSSPETLEQFGWRRESTGGWNCPYCQGDNMHEGYHSLDEIERQKAHTAQENLLCLRQLRRAKRIFWYGVICIIAGAVYFFLS